MNNLGLRSASLILEAIALFRTEILEESRACLHVVTVYDSSLWISHANPNWHTGDPQVILPLTDPTNNSSSSLSWPFFSHYGACGLIFYDIPNPIWLEPHLNLTRGWPPMEIFGTLQRDFNIFIISDKPKLDVVYEFARSTRKLPHSFFLVITSDQFSMYKLRANGLNLVYISTLPNLHTPTLLALNDKNVNYDGSPMLGLVLCGGCDMMLEEFERTGNWLDPRLAIFYELCKLANATLEIEEILSTFRDGLDENGEWDEFTQPLATGLAEISVVLRFSVMKFRAIFITRPLVITNVGFITPRPLKIKYQNLSKILTPFQLDTWLASITSITLLFLALELAFRLGNRRVVQIEDHSLGIYRVTKSKKPHMSRLTLSALLKAAVNQPGLSCEFETMIRRRILIRFLMGMWLTALIILICGYTSTMTSHIVLPSYAAVPTTFQELADSNYKLFVEVWTDNLEHDFANINTSFSRKISARVTETNIVTNECLQVIKEPDQACISFSTRFTSDPSGLLIDTHGQNLFVLGKEARFQTSAQFGVSRYFPTVFGTLDRLISLCFSHGLMESWMQFILSRNRIDARKRARELHVSDQATHKSAEQTISPLLANIVLLGDGVGTVAFFFELYFGLFRRLKSAVLDFWSNIPNFSGGTRAHLLSLCRIGTFYLYFSVALFRQACRRRYFLN